MGISIDVIRQKIQVVFDLFFAVQTAAGVIQVDMFQPVEASVFALAHLIQEAGLFIFWILL